MININLRIKTIINLSLIIILVIFVGINIFYSQNIDKLFYGVTNFRQQSAHDLLKKLDQTNYYQPQLNYFISFYGPDFYSRIDKQYQGRQVKITSYQQLLEKNPKSTDLLIAISLLYYQDNNYLQAKEFYRQAKIIDPWIKIKELEKL